MLYQLGAVQFEVAPLNIHEADRDTGYSFASHDVLGAMPSLEPVGESEEIMSFRGRLFPQRFAELGKGSGLDHLAVLHAMRRSGASQFLMRGDGTPMGWVVIMTISERSTFLGRDGVGRVIEFDIKVSKSGGPSADGIFNALIGMFS